MHDKKHPGLTDVEHTALGEYVRHVANEMGLHDWHLTLMYESAESATEDNKTGARVETSYGKKHACIWVCTDFINIDRDRQRVWIAHELAHVHMDGLDTACRELREPMGYVAWNAWWIMIRYHIEHATNAFAEIIGPTMPYINWPDNTEIESGHVLQG